MIICNDKICMMLNRFFNNKIEFQVFLLKLKKSIQIVCLLGNLSLYYFVQTLNGLFYTFLHEIEPTVGSRKYGTADGGKVYLILFNLTPV